MAQKLHTSVGIEFDNLGIRAAKVSASKKGKYIQHAVEKLEEVRGTFKDDKELIEGLRKVKSKLSVGMNDTVVTCISGKQIHIAQIPFRLVPDNEMKSALKFEVRKSLSFESSSSTLDYQVLQTADAKEETSSVLVVAAANMLIEKHLMLFDKAGMKPVVVDVLPLAISNVFWRESMDKEYGSAYTMIHLSPTSCTMVFDGSEAQFYTRAIAFSASELLGEGKEAIAEAERQRRLSSFADEVKRSLSYYEKTYRVPKFSECYLMGEYVTAPELIAFLKSDVGIEGKYSEFAGVYSENVGAAPGKFDIAIALAMRTDH